LSGMSTVTKDFKRVRVASNTEIYPGYFIISLDLPEPITAGPGQFLQLRLIDRGQFLRRPFGIFDHKDNNIDILYKVRGDITSKISLIKPGESLDLIAPLGNGFDILNKKERPIIVSGGTGFAPLNFLAKKISLKEGLFIIGSAGAESKVFAELLGLAGLDTLVISEDGSVGKKGIVSDYLRENLSSDSIVFSAGPLQMLKSVYSIAEDKGLKTQLSFESHFACGLGLCWGCAIKTKQGTLRVCSEGPVFKGEDILWREI
jgi:dihydroorotate dehydrogenase electron transfer subunit